MYLYCSRKLQTDSGRQGGILMNLWMCVYLPGDQVISGLFLIQFDIACNIQQSTTHPVYSPQCEPYRWTVSVDT